MTTPKKVTQKKTLFEKIKMAFEILKFLFDLYLQIRKMMGKE